MKRFCHQYGWRRGTRAEDQAGFPNKAIQKTWTSRNEELSCRLEEYG